MIDLDALRKVVERATGWGWDAVYRQDFTALIAEVERLRGEVDRERSAVVAFLRARSMSMGKDHRAITGDSVCWAEIELVGAAVNIERGEHRREET